MITPNRITLMNYGLSKLSKKILRDMLNHEELDYSTMDELIRHYPNKKSADVRKAVEELDGRDFLYQDIISKCEQYGYKRKSEYVRDCVRARVPTATPQVDLSETNRQMKAIGNNINQLTIRLHSTGNFYAEDMQEIRQEVSEIWQLLLSVQSECQSALHSATSQTGIRPSTDNMSHLIYADQTAEGQAKISSE